MSILGSVLEDLKQYQHIPLVVRKPRKIEPRKISKWEVRRTEQIILAKTKFQKKKELRAREILKGVCDRHKVTSDEVMGKSHAWKIVAARNELAYLLRQEGWFYNQIGEWLGGKHHTSIIYSVKMHEKRTSL